MGIFVSIFRYTVFAVHEKSHCQNIKNIKDNPSVSHQTTSGGIIERTNRIRQDHSYHSYGEPPAEPTSCGYTHTTTSHMSPTQISMMSHEQGHHPLDFEYSHTVKKRFANFPSPAGMSLPNSPWPGLMTS